MDVIGRRAFARIALRPRRTFASVAVPTGQASSTPDLPPEIPFSQDNTTDVEIEHKDYIRPPSIYQLAASAVVSRPPILTRDLTPLEKEFFFYQRRLDRRLAQPFTRNFYFKPGTLAYDEWRTKRKDMKLYNPYDKMEGWKDELRLGAKPMDDENMDYDSLVKFTVSGEDISASDTEEEIAAKKVMDKPLPRETEADINNDVKSLNRRLSRTLYLLVKRGDRQDNVWKFPQANLVDKENLKQAAEGILTKACGRDMNYWMVGNAPVGHYAYLFPQEYKAPSEASWQGKKVFFMKARVFAGRAKLDGKQARFNDYQWLTKEEIEGVVTTDYWKAVKHILVDR